MQFLQSLCKNWWTRYTNCLLPRDFSTAVPWRYGDCWDPRQNYTDSLKLFDARFLRFLWEEFADHVRFCVMKKEVLTFPENHYCSDIVSRGKIVLLDHCTELSLIFRTYLKFRYKWHILQHFCSFHFLVG
jgi:hypothetical protein